MTKNIKCCSCNAMLDIPEGVNKIYCLYCGNLNPLTDVLEIPGEKPLILISGGTFIMGSNDGYDERPAHKVTLDSFYMNKYQVTNKEYKLYDSDYYGSWDNPDYPVERVSWYEAVGYCNWLSDKEGLERCYSGSGNNTTMDITKNGYRLPTEAEWEYACRAGSTTDYYWGENYNCELDTCPSIDDYAWYYKNSGGTIHPVGQKKPNAWGLYDMIGNANNWCWDWFDDYSRNNVSNPTGPITKCSSRIYRGGCYNTSVISCQSSTRSGQPPINHSNEISFRLVRSK